jgi:titin
LTTREVKEGDSVKFSVKVRGKPPPEVTWYREGTKIVSSPDFEIQQSGDVHSLYIPEVFYEDSGKFSVRLDNRAGHSSCTAELIVEGNGVGIFIIEF